LWIFPPKKGTSISITSILDTWLELKESPHKSSHNNNLEECEERKLSARRRRNFRLPLHHQPSNHQPYLLPCSGDEKWRNNGSVDSRLESEWSVEWMAWMPKAENEKKDYYYAFHFNSSSSGIYAAAEDQERGIWTWGQD
jgi:hypothetical protein